MPAQRQEFLHVPNVGPVDFLQTKVQAVQGRDCMRKNAQNSKLTY